MSDSTQSAPSPAWAALPVEVGEVLAKTTVAEPKLGHDSSTNALIRRYRQRRGTAA